jgi:hypothetical protein
VVAAGVLVNGYSEQAEIGYTHQMVHIAAKDWNG